MSARRPAFPDGRRSLQIGGAALALVALLALASAVWSPLSAADINIGQKLLPPSAAHWLGCDHLGRDIAWQILAGARNSLLAGVVAVGIGLLAGVALGLLAAAAGGIGEAAAMRAADFIFAFPAILSAILLTASFGAGLVNALIAIGIFNVAVFARVTRAAANSIYPREFVLAARLSGCGEWRISFVHVLPNILPLLIVQATIQFGNAILAESALSYLGLGAQPPQVSWGRMLAEAQNFLFQAPSLAIYPGGAIALTVLSLNLVGDGWRDALDPRLARAVR